MSMSMAEAQRFNDLVMQVNELTKQVEKQSHQINGLKSAKARKENAGNGAVNGQEKAAA